jgi:hypothetical protein
MVDHTCTYKKSGNTTAIVRFLPMTSEAINGFNVKRNGSIHHKSTSKFSSILDIGEELYNVLEFISVST